MAMYLAGILADTESITFSSTGQARIEWGAEEQGGGLGHGTHHLAVLNSWLYIGDYRWYIAACTLGLYARATVVFRPLDRDRRMPLLLSFVLIGFFIWLAENISTFYGVWRYPNQVGAWAVVHLGKWSSWSLLVIMTFTIVANLKHIKERIHVPP
jgi:uncharacterized membrane protein YoaT (DUF817 family)